jgi:hypothetical protein
VDRPHLDRPNLDGDAVLKDPVGKGPKRLFQGRAGRRMIDVRRPCEVAMGMERHEVPTVFVRGHADPRDVQYVERQLCNALREARPVSYTVLYIDATPTRAVVEIEAGSVDGTVAERAEADTVRQAGDSCIGAMCAHLAVPTATALPA